MALTEKQELFLLHLEESSSIREAADKAGISYEYARELSKSLKDEIIDRARDKLAALTLKAVETVGNSLVADSDTEKGELRLKAAESVMDRVGLTKHTNVEVKLEDTNGIFILPAKSIPNTPDTDDSGDS